MPQRRPSPIDGYSPLPIFIRFTMAALFGLLLDVILLFVAMPSHGHSSGALLTLRGFWVLMAAVPIIWGILGIFFLRSMLNTARNLFELWFGMRR